jgi:hypothetical protein
MKIPQVANRMREIAQQIQSDYPAESSELLELADELKRRFSGPRANETQVRTVVTTVEDAPRGEASTMLSALPLVADCAPVGNCAVGTGSSYRHLLVLPKPRGRSSIRVLLIRLVFLDHDYVRRACGPILEFRRRGLAENRDNHGNAPAGSPRSEWTSDSSCNGARPPSSRAAASLAAMASAVIFNNSAMSASARSRSKSVR